MLEKFILMFRCAIDGKNVNVSDETDDNIRTSWMMVMEKKRKKKQVKKMCRKINYDNK